MPTNLAYENDSIPGYHEEKQGYSSTKKENMKRDNDSESSVTRDIIPVVEKVKPNSGKCHSKYDQSETNTSLVQLEKKLSLWNGVGINVGIMIGSGIFVSPGSVVRYTGSVGMSLVVWVASGFLCMFGAFCYAELGTMIPKSGGTYAYVKEAYGPVPAFTVLWVNLIIQSPGSRAIGLITFANYLLQPFFPDCPSPPYLAVRLVALAILWLAVYMNCAGVKMGTSLQDFLSLAKVLALIVIIAVGINYLVQGNGDNLLQPWEGSNYDPASIATAFYSTLFAYGGWNALNALMEELRDPYRNLPWAIAISLVTVTVIYVLTNLAYFVVLTPHEIMSSSAVAVTFGNRTMGVIAWIISIFVACSTFGNLNGGLITQSRLTYAGAREGLLPKFAGLLHVHNHTPVTSIILIAILPSMVLFIPDVGSILAYTSFSGGVISVMSISSLLWLRFKQPHRPRPIKVWLGFPIVYLILSVCVCVFPVVRRPVEMGFGVLAFVTGLLVYYLAIHLKIKFIGDIMEKLSDACKILFLCTEEEK